MMSVVDDFSSIISEQADRQFREILTREALQITSTGHWQQELWDSVENSALSLALVPEASGGAGLAAKDAFEIIRLSGYRGLPLPLGDTMLAKLLWNAAEGALELAGNNPILIGTSITGTPVPLEVIQGERRTSVVLEPIHFGEIDASVLLHANSKSGEDFLLLLELQQIAGEKRLGPGLETQCVIRLKGGDVPAVRRRHWRFGHPLVLHAHGALLRSVQMVGAMQRSLELGLEYANERVQFGKTIGRFAPVQDMLVEAAAETSAAITTVSLAIEHWKPNLDEDGVFCIAAAKARCGEAAGNVSALIHQVHGAIGFTQEHTLHRFTRRLWAWREEFGSESFWNRWIGERVCAATGNALWLRIANL